MCYIKCFKQEGLIKKKISTLQDLQGLLETGQSTLSKLLIWRPNACKPSQSCLFTIENVISSPLHTVGDPTIVLFSLKIRFQLSVRKIKVMFNLHVEVYNQFFFKYFHVETIPQRDNFFVRQLLFQGPTRREVGGRLRRDCKQILSRRTAIDKRGMFMSGQASSRRIWTRFCRLKICFYYCFRGSCGRVYVAML